MFFLSIRSACTVLFSFRVEGLVFFLLIRSSVHECTVLLPFKLFQVVSVRDWVCLCGRLLCCDRSTNGDCIYDCSGAKTMSVSKAQCTRSGAHGLKHQQLLVNISEFRNLKSVNSKFPTLYFPWSRGVTLAQLCLLYIPWSRGARACVHTQPFCVWQKRQLYRSSRL